MNPFAQLLARFGPVRLAAALGVLALVAAALLAVSLRMGGEERALLYSDLDMKEAAAITAQLEAAGVKYDLRGDGSSIFVPRSEVMRTRMMLSAEGLPSRGSVGYEIFDNQDPLGATQFQQDMSRLRALEGELARTIVSLDGVRSARVHLVLPTRRLFERDAEQPTASIVLDTLGEIGPGHVRAVRNLVAGAVPGLAPSRVTVLDADGRLLAAGAGGEGELAAEEGDARRVAAEERIRRAVLAIVEGVVGPGAAKVQVTADMDFNRVTQSSEVYDPEGRVIVSTQTIEETNNQQERDAEGGVTAANNLPDGQNDTADVQSSVAGERTEETVNYALSKTTRTEIMDGGRLKRLSVAVAVDGVLTPAAEEGQPPQWAPREAAELERIAALVRSAVGFDQARGDVVEVINVRFAQPALLGTEATDPTPFSLDRLDPMRGLELFAALIAVLATVFFVLRPLVAGLVKPRGAAAAAGQALVAAAPGGAVAIANGGPAAIADAAETPAQIMDMAQIRGKVNENSIKSVGEIVDQHPEEAVGILRGWLNNAI